MIKTKVKEKPRRNYKTFKYFSIFFCSKGCYDKDIIYFPFWKSWKKIHNNFYWQKSDKNDVIARYFWARQTVLHTYNIFRTFFIFVGKQDSHWCANGHTRLKDRTAKYCIIVCNKLFCIFRTFYFVGKWNSIWRINGHFHSKDRTAKHCIIPCNPNIFCV